MDDHLTIHFDGSCMPKNPGGTARYGFTIHNSKGDLIDAQTAVVCSGPSATNNVAEWAGLAAALRHLSKQEWHGNLEIIGDSKLVISQLNGEWKCKKEHLLPYLNECQSILTKSKWNWTATWVPRSKNQEADQLSRK